MDKIYMVAGGGELMGRRKGSLEKPKCNMDCFNCIFLDCTNSKHFGKEAKEIDDAVREIQDRKMNRHHKSANKKPHSDGNLKAAQ